MNFKYGKIYDLALGFANPKKAIYMGDKVSRRKTKSCFIFQDKKQIIYLIDKTKIIIEEESYIRSKRFYQKKLNLLEGKFIEKYLEQKVL